jgi:hypothetical protein
MDKPLETREVEKKIRDEVREILESRFHDWIRILPLETWINLIFSSEDVCNVFLRSLEVRNFFQEKEAFETFRKKLLTLFKKA